MHDLDIDLYNEPFESPYVTVHIMATATCTISVIVCEIITYELPKYRRFESLTFKKKIKAIRNHVDDSNFGYQIECPRI